jgi:hypothetical protein
MKVLLFLIYGTGREYHLELTYSILSAARFLKDDPADVRIVLAADKANQRPDLPVEHLIIDDAMLNEWQMNGAYFHAAKPQALAYAMQHYGAPTILVDSDTIIHAHPKHLFERVAPGKSLLHESEGRLDQAANWDEWQALIEKSGGVVGTREISNASVMQNSGVIGLDPQDAHLMDDFIAVMHGIRAHSTVFTAEQLAASLAFTGPTEIAACPDLVEHYWDGPRPYYRYQMARMFPKVMGGGGIDDKEQTITALDREPPVKMADKIAARLKRLQRGNDGGYIHAYLAYRSALSCQHHDPDLANVWASNALAMLSWGLEKQRPETPDDFAAFNAENLQTLDWMDPGLQRRWVDYWAKLPLKA